MKGLIYCTKGKTDLYYNAFYHKYCVCKDTPHLTGFPILNGKVVAEFDFEVEPIDELGVCPSMHQEELLALSCLTEEQLMKYLNKKGGYAIRIKNLNIFEKPKELKKYWAVDWYFPTKNDPEEIGWTDPIKCAPQNMMRVSEKEWTSPRQAKRENIKILFSIRPEWIEPILNGVKTIEVRKKVLREMK